MLVGVAKTDNRPRAASTNLETRSTPRKRLEWFKAAIPVVPVPQNGSSTTSPGLLPARTQVSASLTGITAECDPPYFSVGSVHTSRLFFPFGFIQV